MRDGDVNLTLVNCLCQIRPFDPYAEAIDLAWQQGYSSEITEGSRLSNSFRQ